MIGRVVSLLATLLVLIIVTFAMVHLIHGNPARLILGPHANKATVAQFRRSLGLDEPLITQFAHYVTHAARLDFGNSFVTRQPVSQILLQRLPRTLELAGGGLVLLFMIGIGGGIAAAIMTREGRHPRFDAAFMTMTGIGGAIPNYLAATLLAFLFAVEWRLLPVSGAGQATSIVLPSLAIASRPSALMMRIVRAEALNVFAQEFMRAARGKRLRRRRIYGRYVLPNVLTPALTYGGLQFTGLVSATVIVENVFAWPGLGTLVVQSIPQLDFPVIQGATLVLGVIVVIAIAVVDAARACVDPQSAIGGL